MEKELQYRESLQNMTEDKRKEAVQKHDEVIKKKQVNSFSLFIIILCILHVKNEFFTGTSSGSSSSGKQTTVSASLGMNFTIVI